MATKPVNDEIQDSRSAVKELQKSIKDLSSAVSGLSKQFQVIGGASKDTAKQIGATVLAVEDLQDSLNVNIDLNSKISKIYQDQKKFLKDQATGVAELSRSANTRAITELKSAELLEASEYKRFVKNNKLAELSKEAINNKYLQYSIDQKLNVLNDQLVKYQNDKTLMSEEEKNLTKEIIQELEKEKVNLQLSYDTQLRIDETLKEQTKELEKQKIVKESINTVGSKLTETLGTQGDEIIEIGHAFKKSMISPLALVGALIGSALEEFGKIGRESRAFLDTSKLTVDQTDHLRHYAHDLSLEYREQGVEMKDVLDSTNALVGQFGSLNRVSDKAVEKATLLGKSFGISADNAAGVMAQLQRSTGVSAETAGNIAALGANFAKAAGVAPDAVMQDIASSSEEIATYFRGTPKDLFKTAVEARRLGLDLKKVANISQSLLNFESSIEDQMTASVLLGREINLDKARQLAMEGKLEDAAKETLSQVGSLADFNKMNAVQKEAIAKAAGLTVGDLQKSLEAQEAIKDMTVEQRTEYEKGLKALNDGNESAADRLLKEQRNQLTQEKIADAVAKISELFANVILPVLEPIFDFVSFIFDKFSWIFKVAKYALTVFVGWKVLLLSIRAISSTIDFFKGLNKNSVGKGLAATRDGIKGIGTLMKEQLKSAWTGSEKESTSVLDTIKNKFKELFTSAAAPKEQSAPTEGAEGGSDVASTIQDKAKEKGGELIDSVTGKADEAVDAEQKMASSPGEGIKTFLKNLGEGLTAMGQGGVFKGAINLIPASIGLVAMIPGALGAAALNKINGKKLGVNLYELGFGLLSMATPGVKQGAISLILAGAGFAALTVGLLGMAAVAIGGEAVGAGLTAIGAGLESLGALAATGLPFLAVALIAALGVSLLMMGGAIYLAASGMAELAKQFKEMSAEQILATAGAFIAFGIGVKILAGAAAVASGAALGFIVITGAILGLALAINIASSGIQTITTSLISLVNNVTGEQLLSVGAGLLSIGAGLAAIGVGGIMALPALLGLAAIAPTLATISSIFGGGEETGGTAAEGEGTGLNEVITKLDSLISAINNQPIQLVVNGKTLAEVVGRGTTRSGAASNK